MEVILLRDIPKVGKKYDVKKVSDGYGMNYLLRQGFAEVATPQKISALSAKKEMNKATDQLQGELLKKALEELDGQKIHLIAKANEQGHLFKGIHREDIMQAIKAEHKVLLPPEMIELEHPIKEIGECEIVITAEKTKKKIILTISREE